MPRVFHWNLRDYTGRKLECNTDRSEAVRNGIPEMHRRDIVVAGFTEVLRGDEFAGKELRGIAKSLNPELERLTLIYAGSVGRRHEWVGIAWTANVDVQWKGVSILSNRAADNVVVVDEPTASLESRIQRTIDESASARGPVFVAGRIDGVPYIFAFLHNVYNNADRRAFTGISVPTMVNQVRSALGEKGSEYSAAHIVVGGDFNVPPLVKQPGSITRSPLETRAPIDCSGDGEAGEIGMEGLEGPPGDEEAGEIDMGGLEGPPWGEGIDEIEIVGLEDPPPGHDEIGVDGADAAREEIVYVKTTEKNTYDYFYVSDKTIPPQAACAYLATRRENKDDRIGSDHAATSLEFLTPSP